MNLEEKRREDDKSIKAVWEVLLEIKSTMEQHLEEERKIQPKLVELVELLERSKGVLIFIRWTAYIGGIAAALLLWAKDHIKL